MNKNISLDFNGGATERPPSFTTTNLPTTTNVPTSVMPTTTYLQNKVPLQYVTIPSSNYQPQAVPSVSVNGKPVETAAGTTLRIGLTALIHILVTFIFASIYYYMRGDDNFNGLDKNSEFIDSLYFSLTTTSTVGYGDISPKSRVAKVLVMVHQTIVLAGVVAAFIPEAFNF